MIAVFGGIVIWNSSVFLKETVIRITIPLKKWEIKNTIISFSLVTSTPGHRSGLLIRQKRNFLKLLKFVLFCLEVDEGQFVWRKKCKRNCPVMKPTKKHLIFRWLLYYYFVRSAWVAKITFQRDQLYCTLLSLNWAKFLADSSYAKFLKRPTFGFRHRDGLCHECEQVNSKEYKKLKTQLFVKDGVEPFFCKGV